MPQTASLKDLAGVFLKLGVLGFGGPAAHTAMMRQEVVLKKKWLSEDEFLDRVGATNLIPGPNSTELAIHIGQVKGGWKGLLIAGFCFIVPAVLITLVFAFFYKQYGNLPQVQPFIYGIKPAIIAIIITAVYPLAKRSLKSVGLIFIGIAVLVGALLNISEIYLIFGAGILAVISHVIRRKNVNAAISWLPFSFLNISGSAQMISSTPGLFWIFLKIGSILYGSGYVLFAFLDDELVTKGLLTRKELLDAIAVGQFTPGPVFSSVTFIGYLIEGASGAAVSTVAIFLPSFVFVALLSLLTNRLRKSVIFSVFLDAVNVASVSIIAAVCFELGKESITDWRTILIAAASLIIALRYKNLNSAFIVLGGAASGYLLSLIG